MSGAVAARHAPAGSRPRGGGARPVPRAALAVLTTALALLTTLAGAAFPAHAATGYRYWSFWERSGAAWTYATRGPAISRPGDGSVEGFRFSVSEDSRDSARPRGTASFGRICADTPERADRKRIAVVLDFGTAADAPSGEIPPKPRTACARIDRDGSAADALAAVAKPLRYDASALLCAISGYPRTGCGEQVDSGSGHREGGTRGPAPHDGAAHAGDGGDGPSVGLFAGIGVLVVLAAGTVWQTRRRRRA